MSGFERLVVSAFLVSFRNVVASTPYAPVIIPCSQDTLVRDASGLSNIESNWISGRDLVTHNALVQWLELSGLNDFDARDFLNSNEADDSQSIRIGLAFSGGGYRAMLSGAGMLAALDGRTSGAYDEGGFGGLFQAASYISGLSGGSWLVGSIAMNNFTTIPSLQASKDVWNFQNVFDPTPAHTSFLGRIPISWTLQVTQDVLGKESSGFPISLTDVWGRYLSAQAFEDQSHGQRLLWSSLASNDVIRNYQMPLPILVFDGILNGFKDVSLNSTVYEASPFEFGSWDPTVYSFVDTQFLGSAFSKGSPGPDNKCVAGYDNAGWLIGASSTLFNQFVQPALQASSLFRTVYTEILKRLNALDINLAIVSNPFENIDYVSEPFASANMLKLVDGGENGENIPFAPLIHPDREVDVILAFDNSADDAHNWPMGEALVSTYQRQFSSQGNGSSFPYVPDANTFVKLGLAEEPVFFGCESNGTEQQTPLVIYLANSKHSYSSNFSTFKLSYNSTERDSMVTNGYNIVTQNNGTLDTSWRSCVACSLILRAQQRRGEYSSAQCNACFSRYCYENIASRLEQHANHKKGEREPMEEFRRKNEFRVVHPSNRQRRDGQLNAIGEAQTLTTDPDGMYEELV